MKIIAFLLLFCYYKNTYISPYVSNLELEFQVELLNFQLSSFKVEASIELFNFQVYLGEKYWVYRKHSGRVRVRAKVVIRNRGYSSNGVINYICEVVNAAKKRDNCFDNNSVVLFILHVFEFLIIEEILYYPMIKERTLNHSKQS
jgi:hypothetical protein